MEETIIIVLVLLIAVLVAVISGYRQQLSVIPLFLRTSIMTLQESLDAANAQIATDTATLAADTAARDAIQAQIDTAAPHLALLAQIEGELSKVEDAVSAEMLVALDAIKANIAPLIAQMRALFTGS